MIFLYMYIDTGNYMKSYHNARRSASITGLAAWCASQGEAAKRDSGFYGPVCYIVKNVFHVNHKDTIMYDRSALIELIRAKSLKFGDFTLASGKKATYYLDCRQITLDSISAKLIGEGILELLQQNPLPQAVGGMSIGADPITAAVITVAAYQNIPLKGFMVRKQSKGHGTNQFVEGPIVAGDRVVIVEDVVTTGGSSLDAIEKVEALGVTVNGVIAIIDRLEGGKEMFESKGYVLRSLFTVKDFGIS